MHCLNTEEVKDLLKKGVDSLKGAGLPDSILGKLDDSKIDSIADSAVSGDKPISDLGDAIGAIIGKLGA